MYLIEAVFNWQPSATEDLSQASYYVNQIIEQWRYNGQIIGREIPLFMAQSTESHPSNTSKEYALVVRCVCPAQQSLLPEFNNISVNNALNHAQEQGIYFDSFQVLAQDLNSDRTYAGDKPEWQLLYTTYLQSCSPLHSGEDNNGEEFLPIPLYHYFKDIPHLAMDIIKWQENWQAYDQLQMNATTLETQALNEISDVHSGLFKHGYALCKEIEEHTGIPTYYYLYRVGGESLEQEQQRKCPLCAQNWLLEKTYFNVLHFKCDHCRIVSNLSWNWV